MVCQHEDVGTPHPRPGIKLESEKLDEETRRILRERASTIEQDNKASLEWTAELKDARVRQLKRAVPR
jgi:uncharacterized membrane protein YgaE (UPF0421/DUF939 family)